ncbi:MAG: glycosyltransferase [Rhodospirillales bacterium]|jgi:tetratricopeptide (TPR) repeat protein|nr:glycosyltransferase [Rhodospirillales bacterium]
MNETNRHGPQSPRAPIAPAAVFREAAALRDAGKFGDGEALLRNALAEHPRDADLWNARGVMLAALGRHADAVGCYRNALALKRDGWGIWTNLGNALTQLRQLKSAIACHERAIALSEGGPLLQHNLGVALGEAGRHGEAAAAFTRALDADPAYHRARWDRARSLLYLGDYGGAWPDYEVRLISGQMPVRAASGQRWDGSHFPGKHLLLLAEQGFGDTLWAARYLRHVKALGGRLTIECQPELIPLLQPMGLAERWIARNEPLPDDADLHGHLCSLPGLFTPSAAAIPPPPYLDPPSAQHGKFQPHIAKAGRRLKVGIIWSGSVTFKRNRERAQTLVRFLQAFAMPGVQLYALQKGPPEQELAALPKTAPIIDLGPLLHDFADTAAAVSQLDLVIMTDSSVAHLAGGLGKPVWVLLGHVAHWLWLLERTDNPWYPSARLFRPRAEGDWDHVFDCAAVELMALANP